MFFRILRKELIIPFLIGLLMLAAFQNCGKAGFESESSAGFSQLMAPLDNRIASAPYPFDANLNQIAYMSCPVAGQTNLGKEPSFFTYPFFTLRAGAYDNREFAPDFGLANMSNQEKDLRLKAGLRLKPEFLTHVENQFKRNDSSIINSTLEGLSLSQPGYLGLGLVNIERSKMSGGFGWDYNLSHSLLTSLFTLELLKSLTQATAFDMSSNRQRTSMFSALDPAERALSGSLTWGKGEEDQKTFARELRNNLQLVLGYSEAPIENITDFVDGSGKNGDGNFSTLLGRGYRLKFSGLASQGGLSALDSRFLVGVEEVELNQRPEINKTLQEGQKWDCFSLRVVRHIDRIDPLTGAPYCTGVDPSTCNGIGDAMGPNNSIIRGVRAVCPSQMVTSLNQRVNLSGQSVRLNWIRLQMARRILPAEFWEVNTDPYHMCAVSTQLSESRGSCYSSGDTNSQRFIQYSLNQTLPDGSTRPCGPTGNECPSFISICYRSH